MKKFLCCLMIAITSCFVADLEATDHDVKVGIVNFKTCVEQSMIGKHEQKSFETLKKEIEQGVKEKEKELSEVANKLNDPDFIDGISPDAENELKHKFRALNQELNQRQSQYFQILQQANYKILQKIGEVIEQASAAVAKEQGLDLILNEEGTFYYSPKIDVSKQVVVLMDKVFQEQQSQEKEGHVGT